MMVKKQRAIQCQRDALESMLHAHFPTRNEFVALSNELITLKNRFDTWENKIVPDTDIRKKLADLPSLKGSSPPERTCKICGGKSKFFDVVDFNKYCGQQVRYVSDISGIEVPYFRCESCEFLFTDFCDDWTPDDFRLFIYNDDYIIVDPEYLEIRPAYTADNMAALLEACENLSIIDYGSGSGGFAKEMAKRGFTKIKNYDPFSSPKRPRGRFNVACLFEVIEHSPTPIDTLKSIFDDILCSSSGIVILTQTVQPDNINEIKGSWWYMGPRNGHISTYSEETFYKICEILDLGFYKVRYGYYVFYRRFDTFKGELRKFIQRTNPDVIHGKKLS